MANGLKFVLTFLWFCSDVFSRFS